jgi:ABC-type multidrug transport system fused ATPase/permease subunit
MTNFQIIKKIFASYIKTAGIMSFIFTVLFGLLVSAVVIFEPLIFTEIIKKIEIFYETGVFSIKDFYYLIWIWWGFIIFSIILQYVYRYILVSKPSLKNHKNVSYEYSEKIISMSYWSYLEQKTWSLYKIYDRWVNNITQFIFFFFLDFLKSITWIIFIVIIMFYINIKMAIVTLFMLPIMIIFGIIFYVKLFPAQLRLNDRWDNIFWVLWNIMSNFFLVKSLWIEKSFKKEMNEWLTDCCEKQINIDKIWSISDIYTASLVMFSRILVLWFGVYLLINWEISFATLFLFFSYIGWIYFPLGMLFGRLRNVQEWLTTVWKFYETFDNLEDDKSWKKWAKISKIEWKVEFKNVSFWYTEKKNILNELNFTVKPWEKVALVGTTWAGKSTIINLILRLWDIENWKIKLDWINIQDITKKSLRQHIWVVSQDNSLFNMTIRENLLFVNPKASDKKIKDALEKAESNFVFDLEKWLDTVIWERGLKLSGWEKQRLSIARLFLKNPEILILDEATSALDNKTEKAIQKALDKLMKWRTSIIVAHRLTTIMDVDNILFLEEGNITESGTYKQLMNKDGKFAELASWNHLMIN